MKQAQCGLEITHPYYQMDDPMLRNGRALIHGLGVQIQVLERGMMNVAKIIGHWSRRDPEFRGPWEPPKTDPPPEQPINQSDAPGNLEPDLASTRASSSGLVPADEPPEKGRNDELRNDDSQDEKRKAN